MHVGHAVVVLIRFLFTFALAMAAAWLTEATLGLFCFHVCALCANDWCMYTRVDVQFDIKGCYAVLLLTLQ